MPDAFPRAPLRDLRATIDVSGVTPKRENQIRRRLQALTRDARYWAKETPRICIKTRDHEEP